MNNENYVDNFGNLSLEKVTDALLHDREKLGLSRLPPDSQITEKYNGRSVLKAFEDGVRLYSYFRKEALLANCLSQNALMLDFGCGWGRFSQLARIDLKPENIFSADISAEALALSEKQGLRRQNLIKLDPGSKFPIESNKFDSIVVNSVFSHLSERSASFYIQELHRVLKEGGILLVGYPSIYGNTVRQGCVGTEISSDDGALLRKLSGTANSCFSFLGLGLATSSRKDTGCMETHCSINL